MQAILSDIHGNLEAFRAVLADIASLESIESIICLGDIVGYGPNPLECVDLAMKMDHVLLGEHDQFVLFDPDGHSPRHERSYFWNRCAFDNADDEALRKKRYQFLESLPLILKTGDVAYVHATPRNPLREYLFPADIHSPRLNRIAEGIEHLCFSGHTHVPGVFREQGSKGWEFFSPLESSVYFAVDSKKTICNVGSVGYPRDEDWRACYCVFDGNCIWHRRVKYDVEATIKKIQAIPELDGAYPKGVLDHWRQQSAIRI